MNVQEKPFIRWFKDLKIGDTPIVGGKNAALGEMYSSLTKLNIKVPNGFAITANAYRYFIEETGLKDKIKQTLANLNTHNIKDLQKKGAAVRKMILAAELPADLKDYVVRAYKELEKMYFKDVDVAVRSSATAEDLPGASFAGQQETFLNVSGADQLLADVKRCIASLFTDRAISYRSDKGFSHFDIALSVGVQKMVRSDMAASGVAFTIDTETGFDKVIIINGSYGLGEMIVQGAVIPDEFVLWKPALEAGAKAIISKNLGQKNIKLIYSEKGTAKVDVPLADREKYCLSDKEATQLAEWCVKVEKHFSGVRGQYQPMDIEWARDGKSGDLYIVQARPETVQATADKNVLREYRLKTDGKAGNGGKPALTGIAVGSKIASGKVRVIKDAKKINDFKKDEVLVTEITDPDWEPIMKIASAIVTDKGGRTSHAAIVSRELGIPCIVGTENATKTFKNGDTVTVDCSSGNVGNIFRGIHPFEVIEHRLDKLPDVQTKVMVNIGAPDEAFKHYNLPVKGVGLGRLEFIIASGIRIHPNILIDYQKLKNSRDPKVSRAIKEVGRLTKGYDDKKQYYVEKLVGGIAKIAAAFHPRDVIIRFSDFKTNEYIELLGGDLYEPKEENPMIGWRGASRYYDPKFKDAFGLECAAMKRVRDEMGLTNVVPMIPFCRTPEEAKEVVKIMTANGLDRAKDKTLRIYVMCEIPSNIILADEFLEIFDGMSIGSNDLTQLTLGLDRDSGIVTHIANENSPAVMKLIEQVIAKCKEKKKYVGICGQAPSDFPKFAEFLVEKGIESISLNPDTVIKTILDIAQEEKKIMNDIKPKV